MFSCGWLWMYAGAAMMFLELLTPGFVMFFFGLSAASVGLLRLASGDAFTATWQLVAFSAFSIVYLFVLRRWVKSVFAGDVSEESTDAISDTLAGRTGTVTEPVNPPASGRVMIGDAEWTAIADAPIASGVQVRVTSQRNLTVKVEPICA